MISVNRREFLQSTMAGAAVAAVGCTTAARKRKPNLLFIWTDQQNYNTMRVYGNACVKAPNLNRLAEQSVVFRNAYVTQAVCTPSRSSVMTGLYPHQNGCTANNIPLPLETPCFPELLNDSDYRTGYFGKWHLGDEIYPQHGFEEWQAIEYYRGHYRDFRDKTKNPGYHDWLVDKGYSPPDGQTVFPREWCTKLPIEHCKPKYLETVAVDFLERHKSSPFILHVNFFEPHNPYNGPLNNLHADADCQLPDSLNDTLDENDPLRYRAIRERRASSILGNDAAKLRTMTRKYYGMVAQVDRSVGAILAKLEQLGLADNTIVVFTSDHGCLLGHHGMMGKGVMFEESARVPLLMRIPGMRLQQHVVEQPVCNVDLVPTLLDLMNGPAVESLPGQSLRPLLQGEMLAEPHVFMEWNDNRNCNGTTRVDFASAEEVEKACQENSRAVVSPNGWKLCLSDRDKHQLYNLRTDPLETVNLFSAGGHKDVVVALTERIHVWQKRTGDTVEVDPTRV